MKTTQIFISDVIFQKDPHFNALKISENLNSKSVWRVDFNVFFHEMILLL